MARDEAITAIRFPIRLLTVACLLTIMAFAWFVWIIFDARRDTEMFTDQLSRIEQLRGVIVHLDEVLTMSARMAAVTGDSRWEERYHHFEPQLDAAIKETIKIGAGSSNIKAATKTDEANIKLVEMENRAFALVRAGRKEAAQTVLFSPEYETQKQIYAEGITSFTSQIRREFDESLRDDQRLDLLSIIAAVVAGGISFVAWLSAARGVRRWRARLLDSLRQRAEAEENLRKAHANLEVRVQERTADLAKSNAALTESQGLYHSLVEHMAAGVFRKDREGRYVFVNSWFCRLKDMKADEILGKTPRELAVYEASVAEAGRPSEMMNSQRTLAIQGADHHELIMRTGKPIEVEEVYPQPDGTTRHFQAVKSPVFVSDGEIIGTQGILFDITVRKRTEEQLRVQATALDAVANAIVITDHNGTIQSVNPAFTALTGYTAPEAVGQNPRLLKSGKQDEAFYRNLWQTISSGRVWSGELINRRKDGSLYVEEMTITPLRNADGMIARYIAIKQDISGRKQVEEEKARLLAIIEESPDFIGLADLQGNLQYHNRAAKKMVGLPEDADLTHLKIRDMHPGWAAKRVEEEGIPTVLREGSWESENVLLHRNGSEIPVSQILVVHRDSSGEPKFVSTIMRDITARKELEAQMERLRTEHALILNSIGEGVHWVDVDGRIRFENPAAAKMLGHEVSELIGKPAHATMHHTRADGAAYPQSECLIHATLRDGMVRRVTDEVFWRKDGSSFAVEYLCTPVCDKNGRSGGSVVIFTDITGRKRLEAQLFQSQKLETVGKLAGGVAHEFNSIMTAIIGHSELMLRDLPSGHPLVQDAAGIRRAAERAATLTRQLLAYGRRAFLRPEALDLNQVMAGTEGMVRQIMGGDVDMRIVPAEDLRAVKADAGQIEQVIMNLAMNARDAMPNGGKLTLETANIAFDQEHVGRDPELKSGDYVMLAITDTGTGMSAEVKARAFEPFFTTKGVGEGTGLGLSTCYGIIKQSGGHISVYTELGRGTTFKIYLPQVEPQVKILLQRLDSPDLPRGTETILLVEDDPALREMAATLLKRLGYTVLAAANGIEALSLKQPRDNGHVDLLFTDVVMPHMSGKELADRVQALYPHTRVLFTFAYTGNAIVHQGVLNKGVALLQKPFTPSALAHKLREVLDQPGAPKPDPRGENI